MMPARGFLSLPIRAVLNYILLLVLRRRQGGRGGDDSFFKFLGGKTPSRARTHVSRMCGTTNEARAKKLFSTFECKLFAFLFRGNLWRKVHGLEKGVKN